MAANNLLSLFAGGTKRRELRDTHRAWEETQAFWRASPLATTDARELSIAIVKEAAEQAERAPALNILVAIGMAVEELLRAETIGDLEANWPLIESDVGIAVEFRQMLARRRRWSADFTTMHGEFRRIVLSNIGTFLKALPESCFVEFNLEQSGSFEVPLIDLVDEPANVIEQLFLLPYDDASFRLDLFWQLRELCAGNLLVASGFARSDHPREHENKLLMPTRQNNNTGAELAALYLGGSPLKELSDLPLPFCIPKELRFEHCHIIGGTGHGKTQLMQKLIHGDLVESQRDNRSVVVIDSQGDLINKLVRLELFSPDAPHSLGGRLVIIDPADVDYPAALNLFDAHLARADKYSAADRERVLNGVIELYELFFGAFLGAELTQKQGVIFKYLARLMLAIPNATILTLMRLMEDGKPYQSYMDSLDGSARYFFQTEFFHPSFAATKKQILRRLWGVLSTPAFERMFTQENNKLDVFEAMNEGKIILVNTAKDLLKRDGSQLMGRFFIAMIAQAALERSTLAENERNSAFVYVDEAQEYFDDSIETILNQARKYRVGLTLAHQTLDQLSPRLRSVLLANTSMKCAGGVSAKDAHALAEELRTTPDFIESMKRRGPRSEFALWVKNLTGQAIRLTVPLGFLESQATLTEEDYDALIAANRERYCGTRATLLPTVEPLREAPEFSHKPSTMPPQNTADRGLECQLPNSTNAQPPAMPITEKAVEARNRLDENTKIAYTVVSGEEKGPGKGGAKHRYLQSLVKKLAEEQGLKATIEAPLAGGGQVDVLIEQAGVAVAVEISVTTPVEYEVEKLRKYLALGYARVALVVAKIKGAQQRHHAVILNELSEPESQRINILAPEDIPDFIAGLFPTPEPSETMVKGYRVRVSHALATPAETKARREQLTRVIARSLGRQQS